MRVRGLVWGGVLLAAVMMVGACGDEDAKRAPLKPPASPVRVVTALKDEIHPSVSLVGTVEPWKRSLVAGEVAGRVKQFLVKEGETVEQGQLLAQLATKTLQIQLDSAVASRREGLVRHQKAIQDVKRIQGLVKKGFLTQKEYDDAEAEELAWEQRLAQLNAEIRRVEDQIAKSRILAPFTGQVIREHTEIGQWVDEGGTVVEIVDLSRVQVEVPLPERYVQSVASGDPVSATFDGLPGFTGNGHIRSVVAQADQAARTFPVNVEIPNEGVKIKSGMVARVKLFVGAPYKAILVPKDALVLRGQSQFIFLVDEGKAMQVAVTPGVYTDGLVEITSGVPEGASVVTQGNERLLPGQAVRILNEG